LGSKSAQKVARGSIRRQKRNKATESKVKTNVARAEKLIAEGNKDEAKKAVGTAASALRKSANKKNIHPNAASRRTSRLMKKLNKGPAAPKVKAADKAA
jgi:small subunit ribosomal protein S20